MKTNEFLIPSNLNETLDALEVNPDCLILAGGTDVIVKELLTRKTLVINRVKDLNYIINEEDIIRIGACTTHADIIRNPLTKAYLPLLIAGLKTIGSVQIRNIATLGGNIANSSPVGDSLPPLYVMGSDVTLISSKGERDIPINDFITGVGKNILKHGEIIKEIRLAKQNPDEIFFFKKLGPRKGLAISKVSVAFRASLDNNIFTQVKIAMGAVGVTVVTGKQTEDFLINKEFNMTNIEHAARILREEVRPITDIRSEDWYRKEMVGSIMIEELMNKISGK